MHVNCSQIENVYQPAIHLPYTTELILIILSLNTNFIIIIIILNTNSST